MITYIKYLLFVGVMCSFVSCQRGDGPLEVPENGKVIEFRASANHPKSIKGLISSVNDLVGDGFVVWGMSNTISGGSKAVFDTYGTMVSAVADDGGNVDSWYYEDKKYWFSGTYSFAALLPASAIDASGEGTGKGLRAVQSNEKLLLTGNYTLDSQVDLMHAFAQVDNTEREDLVVQLSFNHLWSQFGLRFKSGGERVIEKIELCGISRNVVFSSTEITSDAEDNLAAVRGIVTKTSDGSAFAAFSKPAENSSAWTINKAAGEVALVDGFMLFPINLEEMPVTIQVTCTTGSTTKTLKGTISSGEWISGQKYVYTLDLGSDNIIVGEPNVVPWEDGGNIDKDIQ